MPSSIKPAGAGLFAAAGFASALALAACCALPIGLAAIGLGSAWLNPIVRAAKPHGTLLDIVAIVSIAASVGLVTVAARTCAPGDLCARRGFRFSICGVALISLILLVAGRIYG
jgi:mercuric ion transport protein